VLKQIGDPAASGGILAADQAAMALQLFEQRRQTSAQRAISGSFIASHAAAHWRQISAQAPHITLRALEPRSIASALVAQMSAHVASNAMCSGAACAPPLDRQ